MTLRKSLLVALLLLVALVVLVWPKPQGRVLIYSASAHEWSELSWPGNENLYRRCVDGSGKDVPCEVLSALPDQWYCEVALQPTTNAQWVGGRGNLSTPHGEPLGRFSLVEMSTMCGPELDEVVK